MELLRSIRGKAVFSTTRVQHRHRLRASIGTEHQFERSVLQPSTVRSVKSKLNNFERLRPLKPRTPLLSQKTLQNEGNLMTNCFNSAIWVVNSGSMKMLFKTMKTSQLRHEVGSKVRAFISNECVKTTISGLPLQTTVSSMKSSRLNSWF